MYTYTPTHRFLVLSATDSAPYNPATKFLVLSPTENGPDARVWDEQPLLDSLHPAQAAEHHRADSSSSASTDSFNDVAATLPNGFLFLGHSKPRRGSQ